MECDVFMVFEDLENGMVILAKQMVAIHWHDDMPKTKEEVFKMIEDRAKLVAAMYGPISK